MPANIIRGLKWLYAPGDVSFLTAFLIFGVSLLLYGCMCVYFYGVIQDNDILNENPMYNMMNDADSLIKDIRDDMCGLKLLEKYKWLKQVDILINSNCNITPDNLKYLRYTGYSMAIYNTIFMHLLLCGVLPVSVIACVPIITSFISTFIKPTQIVMLGFFEFSQMLLTLVILITFIAIKENKMKSQLNVSKRS
jgi:hypothetical protein